MRSPRRRTGARSGLGFGECGCPVAETLANPDLIVKRLDRKTTRRIHHGQMTHPDQVRPRAPAIEPSEPSGRAEARHKNRLPPEPALMTPLRSITAYNGWLILEYSERVDGKLKTCFSVQQSPDNPIQAGHSLKEAKQAIDGSSVEPTARPQRVQSSGRTGLPLEIKLKKFRTDPPSFTDASGGSA